MKRRTAWARPARRGALPKECLLLIFVLPALLAAAASGEDARQILDRRKAVEERWTDRSQRLTLTIRDREGRTRQRELELFERRYPAGELRTLVLLQGPADLKGMSFLAYTHPNEASRQWLYTRSARRPRAIAPEARKEPFIDSDLTYDDLEILARMPSWEETDASSLLDGKESVGGIACYRIELAPTRSPYPRIVIWLGREDLVPRRLALYSNVRGFLSRFTGDAPPTKIITQSDVRAVASIPMAFHVEIETPAAGTHTSISVAEAKFDQSLRPELFREEALEQNSR